MSKAGINPFTFMSRTKLFCTAQIIALAALLIGCGKKTGNELDFGAFNNSVYTNNYFGLTVAIPAGWSIQDQEAQRRIMALGGNMVAGEDKNMKALMKASELQTVNLFAAFKYPLGTPVTFNPSILALAEKVSQMPGIKRGKDYLFFTKKTLESGKMQISYPKEIYTERLGGVDFDVMDVELSLCGTMVKEKYYVAIMKSYALSFIVTFTNNEEESSGLKILNEVRFQ
jgi:hypothetical protein